MSKIEVRRQKFVDLARKNGIGKDGTISRAEVIRLKNQYGMPLPTWITNDPNRKISYGSYSFPEGIVSSDELVVEENVIDVSVSMENKSMITGATNMNLVREVDTISNDLPENSLIPVQSPLYIRHGNHGDVEKIVSSNMFLPIWVTGLSGNGKTFMIEQICAKLGREYVRVNITGLTDEDDLIGGFRLINGETVWQDGPVTLAMKRGAILLLDECDLGTEKIMCLQPVLEGNGIFIKKINTFVSPKKGFNVIATANTKAQGGENSDRFVGTQIMNEAFLERFAITLEQDYPTKIVERKILGTLMDSLNCVNNEFADNLISWADGIRRTFAAGGISDIITTRRLCQIIKNYSIFGDVRKSITQGIARFNEESREAFLNLFDKICSPPVEETVPASNEIVAPSSKMTEEEKNKYHAEIVKKITSSKSMNSQDMTELALGFQDLAVRDSLISIAILNGCMTEENIRAILPKNDNKSVVNA
jgi:hypothetical protein